MTNTAKLKRNRRSAQTAGNEPQTGNETSSNASDQVALLPAAAPVPEPATKPDSKSAKVIALLQREEGATLSEMVAETGWLPHTTRAAMTGLKRKGHTITSVKINGVRRYHANAAATAQ